jgi:hypothetical protein
LSRKTEASKFRLYFSRSSPCTVQVSCIPYPNPFTFKGPITWRTFNPGVELSPVNRVEIFCDYIDDFNPGVETLYYTFSASIPEVKKPLFCFLVINSH